MEAGFEASDPSALESLVVILQSFLHELGQSARSYHELASRARPLLADVIMALVSMGISLKGIETHAKRLNRTILAPLAPSVQPKQLSILQAGMKQALPSYIPSHFPQFPDPHAYIRTPTHKQPVTEYEAIREKAASQKRSLEKALTKFVSKTGETDSLFPKQENDPFLLIACKLSFPPYLSALLPKDQVFDFDEEENAKPLAPRKKKEMKGTEQSEEEAEQEEEERAKAEADMIDNPYLRPVKPPPTKLKIKGNTVTSISS